MLLISDTSEIDVKGEREKKKLSCRLNCKMAGLLHCLLFIVENENTERLGWVRNVDSSMYPILTHLMCILSSIPQWKPNGRIQFSSEYNWKYWHRTHPSRTLYIDLFGWQTENGRWGRCHITHESSNRTYTRTPQHKYTYGCRTHAARKHIEFWQAVNVISGLFPFQFRVQDGKCRKNCGK